MRTAVAIALVVLPTLAPAAEWTPRAYARESTLELRTTAPGEAEHWFPVWLVVIDDQLYVRLGSRAAGRIERNLSAPFVGVRVAGQQFDRMRGVPVPDRATEVARAMSDKYWFDVVVHHLDHPLTLRLTPE